MEGLKFSNIIDLYLNLCKKYKKEEVLKMPIVLGDDEELNGVHGAFYIEQGTTNVKHYDYEDLEKNKCDMQEYSDSGLADQVKGQNINGKYILIS